MPIYAKAGESLQYIMTESQARKIPDLVLMSGKRPSEYHVASADGIWVEDPDAYRVKREAAYPPIGDQLDALLKHLNKMRLDGTDLVEELDSIIGQWLAVKKDYPKPE